MTTVVIAGAMANKPWNGGEAWVRLSWIETFRQLGFSTHFVEQLSRACCVDAGGQRVPPERSENVAFFEHVIAHSGLDNHATLVLDDGRWARGATFESLERALDDAVLFNISGNLRRRDLLGRCAVAAYVDIDPGFTQIWADRGLLDGVADHDFHLTIGENIGTDLCALPTAGYQWLPVRQPVVLEQWPVVSGPCDGFTTVARWRATGGPIEHGGRRYGLKLHEFRRFIEVPARTGLSFEVALDIEPGDVSDRELLSEHGWKLVDPRSAASDPDAFRAYVQQSGAEFSVAQAVYVETASGWFSDRTLRYLASGKPAVVQDTGLSAHLPTGNGLLTFRTIDDAVTAARMITADYENHCTAARQIAVSYFAHDLVGAMILERIGVGVPSRPGLGVAGQ